METPIESARSISLSYHLKPGGGGGGGGGGSGGTGIGRVSRGSLSLRVFMAYSLPLLPSQPYVQGEL